MAKEKTEKPNETPSAEDPEETPPTGTSRAEVVGVAGQITLTLRGPDGKVKQVEKANTVTTAGKNGIADQILAAPTLSKPTHMAIGTGSPAATLLGAEIDRNALTSKLRSGAVVTMVGDWAAGDGTGAITEAGIFDIATANTVNMWCSASFAVVNKAVGDTLSISWTLTIS